MGENTKIEWATHSWNAWLGCQEVSAACDLCYAKAWANRYGKSALWNGKRQRTSEHNWKQPIKWNAEARRLGQRQRVFVNSMSDFFDNQVPPEWRHDAFNVMAQCLWLDFLLLTKRPQNIPKLAPQMAEGWRPWAPNIWLGTTVENREEMLRRGPLLKAIPATVHFWSAEPLLEDLGTIPPGLMPDWIICGGESGGSAARPMHPEWARSIRDQCVAAGVPYFFKQHGQWLHESQSPGFMLSLSDERETHVWPDDTGSASVGKKNSGRLLDGLEWNEVPVIQREESVR